MNDSWRRREEFSIEVIFSPCVLFFCLWPTTNFMYHINFGGLLCLFVFGMKQIPVYWKARRTGSVRNFTQLILHKNMNTPPKWINFIIVRDKLKVYIVISGL